MSNTHTCLFFYIIPPAQCTRPYSGFMQQGTEAESIYPQIQFDLMWHVYLAPVYAWGPAMFVQHAHSNAPWYSCMYRLWLYMLHAAGTYSVTPVLHDSSVCADLAFIPLVATKKFVIIWPDDATHGDVQLIRGRNRYVRLSLVFFCLLLYRWY